MLHLHVGREWLSYPSKLLLLKPENTYPDNSSRQHTRPWSHLAINFAGAKYDAKDKPFYMIVVVDNHNKKAFHASWYALRAIGSKDIIQFLAQGSRIN